MKKLLKLKVDVVKTLSDTEVKQPVGGSGVIDMLSGRLVSSGI